MGPGGAQNMAMAPPKSRQTNLRPTSKQVPKWGAGQSSNRSREADSNDGEPHQPSIEPKE